MGLTTYSSLGLVGLAMVVAVVPALLPHFPPPGFSALVPQMLEHSMLGFHRFPSMVPSTWGASPIAPGKPLVETGNMINCDRCTSTFLLCMGTSWNVPCISYGGRFALLSGLLQACLAQGFHGYQMSTASHSQHPSVQHLCFIFLLHICGSSWTSPKT